MGSSAALSMFWLLPPQFMSRAALAAGLGLISTFGSIASFVAPILIGWVRDTTNSSFLVYLTPKQYRPGGPQPLMPEEAKASS